MVKNQALLLLVLSSACVQAGIDQPADSSTVDFDYYRCLVQPILARSCAFMDCHGNSERPLSIYAEQRFREKVDWLDFEAPLSDPELLANFKTASGFISQKEGASALLSEKPLDARNGGLFHRGRDSYGIDDVFLSTDEDDYKTLRAFVDGATESADCTPSGDSH